MATRTPNHGFLKPSLSDFANIEDMNENWDKIDEELSGTLPIEKGGTGASNSSKARENLGITQENWTFTLEDGSTVIKAVYVG